MASDLWDARVYARHSAVGGASHSKPVGVKAGALNDSQEASSNYQDGPEHQEKDRVLTSSDGASVAPKENVPVDDIGLDKANKSQGKAAALSELAHKLAQFDIGSLWRTLGDSERRNLFAYAVKQLEGIRDC